MKRSYAEVKLTESSMYSDIAYNLDTEASLEGGYGLFSANANVEYLKSIKDTDYSMSFNYYTAIKNDVDVQLDGTGEHVLTEFGLGTYKNNNGKYFGTLCGNYFIDTFTEGAFLTMAIKLKFLSKDDKDKFAAAVGVSVGNFFQATAKFSKESSETQVRISIELTAFQLGGDPSQLSKIFSTVSDGTNHIFECSVDSIESCSDFAKSVLNYAQNDFTSQFIVNADSYVGLGLKTATFIPVEQLGLHWQTLVTEDIKNYRKRLIKTLKEQEYYEYNLNRLLKDYPVDLDPEFKNKCNGLLDKINNNLKSLKNPLTGAGTCWTDMDNCSKNAAVIYEKLYSVTSKDLEHLKPIQYIFSVRNNECSNKGCKNPIEFFIYSRGSSCNTTECWDVTKGSHLKTMEIKFDSLSNAKPTYYYELLREDCHGAIIQFSTDSSLSTNNVMTYSGMKTTKCTANATFEDLYQHSDSEIRKISPFFFELYK